MPSNDCRAPRYTITVGHAATLIKISTYRASGSEASHRCGRGSLGCDVATSPMVRAAIDRLVAPRDCRTGVHPRVLQFPDTVPNGEPSMQTPCVTLEIENLASLPGARVTAPRTSMPFRVASLTDSGAAAPRAVGFRQRERWLEFEPLHLLSNGVADRGQPDATTLRKLRPG